MSEHEKAEPDPPGDGDEVTVKTKGGQTVSKTIRYRDGRIWKDGEWISEPAT